MLRAVEAVHQSREKVVRQQEEGVAARRKDDAVLQECRQGHQGDRKDRRFFDLVAFEAAEVKGGHSSSLDWDYGGWVGCLLVLFRCVGFGFERLYCIWFRGEVRLVMMDVDDDSIYDIRYSIFDSMILRFVEASS